MPQIIIGTREHMGPLTIQLLTDRGRAVPAPALLSSARHEIKVRVPEGDYVVIGTRPNGQTLTLEARVDRNGGRAFFSAEDASPNEFMRDATVLGLVPKLSEGVEHFPDWSPSRFQLSTRTGVSGDASRALAALVSAPSAGTAISFTSGDFSPGALQSDAPSQIPDPKASFVWKSLAKYDLHAPEAQRFWIREWVYDGSRWRDHLDDRTSVHVGDGYVRVKWPTDVEPYFGPQPRAIGLVSEAGFGPIVHVPQFRSAMDIVFLADGVTSVIGADRVTNPSLLKVPVALAMPEDPALADMLSVLGAAGAPGAEALVTQQTHQQLDIAFSALNDKQADPAAAALGAHYLLRFAPKRIPVQWLRNLTRWAPLYADGPILLAQRLILAGGSDDIAASPQEIRDLLRNALQRPVFLFARSRSLLAQATRIYGPRRRTRKLVTAVPRKPSPAEFLDVAAGAGGLDAYWGTGPGRLGNTPRWPRADIRERLASVELRNGIFSH